MLLYIVFTEFAGFLRDDSVTSCRRGDRAHSVYAAGLSVARALVEAARRGCLRKSRPMANWSVATVTTVAPGGVDM